MHTHSVGALAVHLALVLLQLLEKVGWVVARVETRWVVQAVRLFRLVDHLDGHLFRTLQCSRLALRFRLATRWTINVYLSCFLLHHLGLLGRLVVYLAAFAGSL